ncbi:MAG: hypothetical protein QOE90_3570 [Thermoplasmata archaeon]|jgi:hypothetical protein|nr:hypothetical protein [Thermoplasmata archaeon]
MRGRRDDRAVSEVIGFILSFALSSVFLLIALGTYYQASGNTDNVITGVELKGVADRVATRIVDAGLIAQEFPNASLNITMDLPQTANGHSYLVTATATAVWVNATDGVAQSNSTTFKLDQVSGISISGSVYSTQERIVVGYSLQSAGTSKQIVIHGA